MQVKSHATIGGEIRGALLGWVLSTASWLLLGGWFGSWALFAWVIAPTAFQVLPSQELAGKVVAPILETLHQYGIGAGLALAGLAALRGGGPVGIVGPLLLAGLCTYSQYGVTPAIDEVSARSFGATQDSDAAARFSQLHELSRTLFAIVELGVVGLMAREAWGRPSRQRPS